MSVLNGMPPATAEATAPRITSEITLELTPFDQRPYRRLIAARAETIRRVARKLKPAFGFSSALDAGCGTGFFSKTLAECGLNACGFDGRKENIAEARKRYPEVPFETGDIEERGILELGKFDFVLCCGLLYHLRHPLAALERIRSVTLDRLILETHSLIPAVHERVPMMTFFPGDEAPSGPFHHEGGFPTKAWLASALHAAGFARCEFVYTPSFRYLKKLRALITNTPGHGRLIAHAFVS